MATTLKQATDQLAEDAGIIGHADFPPSVLYRYLNLAQKYVQKVLNGLGIKKWEHAYDASSNLVAYKYNGIDTKLVTMAQIKAGSGYDVGIAPNSIRLIEVGNALILGTSTVFGIAKPADEQIFHKLLASSYSVPTLTEPRFLWQDNQIILAPSTILSAKIHFYRVVKDLAVEADEFEVPDEFIDHVIARAIIDVKNKQKLLNDKQEAIAKLDKDIKDMFQSYMNTVATDQANKQQQLQ